MYNEKMIEQAIKSIFNLLLSDYSDEEVEDELAVLDFEAIAQAVRDNVRTVYTYETGGDYMRAYTYRGTELFSQRATKLFETVNYYQADLIITSHSYELWLLEDMTVMVVSNMSVKASSGDSSFVSEYRTVKGELDSDNNLCFVPEDLTEELNHLCEPQLECTAPFYEL